MYPRARLDALTDGIFGVAMTLLVLDVRLPDEFHPRDAAELLRALFGLMPKFLPYVLSFGVLGLRWLRGVELQSKEEVVGSEYVYWWLLYLLLITCVPFAAIVVGRFANLPPAIWLYAGNIILISVIGLRLLALAPRVERSDLLDHQVSLILMILSSVLAISWSFVNPSQALWALVLNFAAPAIKGWRRKLS